MREERRGQEGRGRRSICIRLHPVLNILSDVSYPDKLSTNVNYSGVRRNIKGNRGIVKRRRQGQGLGTVGGVCQHARYSTNNHIYIAMFCDLLSP